MNIGLLRHFYFADQLTIGFHSMAAIKYNALVITVNNQIAIVLAIIHQAQRFTSRCGQLNVVCSSTLLVSRLSVSLVLSLITPHHSGLQQNTYFFDKLLKGTKLKNIIYFTV
ncbi:hypothetical protein PBPRB0029 [Photobacterium profundum SS9]|uniref:Uncharacterized protein n=1 Tax=Photobacterium profundum (strain SS9) TaxID=298386 RepID=Q6LL81_PHOPR|nr:hypothetical protein PBPRB0029 [Photobacterium profundum SS9]